jgi:8-oxo-dGTP pyrophosphatase MutT (NUDIX family)
MAETVPPRVTVEVMRWTVHGERTLYSSPHLDLLLADVEVPGGPRFAHHLVRYPYPAVGVLVVRPDDGALLLLWRHRFATDSWGWEVPAGRMEAGETPAQAGAREVEEETGWRLGEVRHVLTYHPLNGTVDQTFHVLRADGATHVGDPVDAHESSRIEWVPGERVVAEFAAGRVTSGLTVTALLSHLAGVRTP